MPDNTCFVANLARSHASLLMLVLFDFVFLSSVLNLFVSHNKLGVNQTNYNVVLEIFSLRTSQLLKKNCP